MSSLIEINNEHDAHHYFASVVETRKVIQYRDRWFSTLAKSAGIQHPVNDRDRTSSSLIVIEAAILKSLSPLAALSPLLVFGYAGPSVRLGIDGFGDLLKQGLTKANINLLTKDPEAFGCTSDASFDRMCELRRVAPIGFTTHRSLTFRTIPYIVLLDVQSSSALDHYGPPMAKNEYPSKEDCNHLRSGPR